MQQTFEIPQGNLVSKQKLRTGIFYADTNDIPKSFSVERTTEDEITILFIYPRQKLEFIKVQHRLYIGKDSGRLLGFKIPISTKQETLTFITCLIHYLSHSSKSWVKNINYENCRLAVIQDPTWLDEVLAWKTMS